MKFSCRIFQRVLPFVALMVLSVCFATSANAERNYVPYLGYEYNAYEESVPAPVGYTPTQIYSGEDMGIGSLNAPKDMYFYGNKLYILDSGNSRIVITDENMKVERVIQGFTMNGEEIRFDNAQGLFVTKSGSILVADTENLRILEANQQGNVLRIITRPETKMIAENREFQVTKVMQDENGRIYALVKGINEGAVTFDTDGKFAGFFASNEVVRTAEVIFNYFWRNFMTEAQIRNSQKYMPSEFTNFDVNSKGFIYTVTQTTKGSSSVRLLNYKGSNLQKSETEFGDLEWDRKVRNSVSTTFIDVDVGDGDYVYLLDSARGRVFEYSSSGFSVSIFGGLGNQLGTFKSAKAIETFNGRVYVLDDLRNAITVFDPTEYVTAIKKAIDLYEEGNYDEACRYWEKVLQLNSNSEIAYYGIGLALYEAGRAGEALKYFKHAYANKAYSNSFREVRKDFIKANFVILILFLVALIVGCVFLARFLKRKFFRKDSYAVSALEQKYVAPLFTSLHPLDGFENLQRKNGWSMKLCMAILTLLFLSLSASWFFTGFSFNDYRASDFNVLITLSQAYGIVAVGVISNWAVCTLIEGKGRLKDIFGMTVYALVPFLVSIIVAIILSNVLTLEEKAFLLFIKQLGVWWTAVLLLCGLSRIHQFSFGKTLFSVLLTILGMAIIIFLMIMFFGLMQQLFSFVKSIYSEIQLML